MRIYKAPKDYPGQLFENNSSQQDQDQVASRVYSKERSIAKLLKKIMFLGNNKEIIDAKLWLFQSN